MIMPLCSWPRMLVTLGNSSSIISLICSSAKTIYTIQFTGPKPYCDSMKSEKSTFCSTGPGTLKTFFFSTFSSFTVMMKIRAAEHQLNKIEANLMSLRSLKRTCSLTLKCLSNLYKKDILIMNK